MNQGIVTLLWRVSLIRVRRGRWVKASNHIEESGKQQLSMPSLKNLVIWCPILWANTLDTDPYIHICIYIDIVYIYSIGLNHEITFLLEPYRDPVVVWKVRNLPGSSSCSEAGERRVADGVSLACGTGAPKKNPRFHHWKRDLRLGTFSFFLRSQQSLLLMVANITHHQSFAIGITRLLC